MDEVGVVVEMRDAVGGGEVVGVGDAVGVGDTVGAVDTVGVPAQPTNRSKQIPAHSF